MAREYANCKNPDYIRSNDGDALPHLRPAIETRKDFRVMPQTPATDTDAPRKPLSDAAKRALAEADARRAAAAANAVPAAPEINGPKGPEPTRFGDWEVRGIASDF